MLRLQRSTQAGPRLKKIKNHAHHISFLHFGLNSAGFFCKTLIFSQQTSILLREMGTVDIFLISLWPVKVKVQIKPLNTALHVKRFSAVDYRRNMTLFLMLHSSDVRQFVTRSHLKVSKHVGFSELETTNEDAVQVLRRRGEIPLMAAHQT